MRPRLTCQCHVHQQICRLSPKRYSTYKHTLLEFLISHKRNRIQQNSGPQLSHECLTKLTHTLASTLSQPQFSDTDKLFQANSPSPVIPNFVNSEWTSWEVFFQFDSFNSGQEKAHTHTCSYTHIFKTYILWMLLNFNHSQSIWHVYLGLVQQKTYADNENNWGWWWKG
jgi:hypothetical protein